jgi:hypothetical protein
MSEHNITVQGGSSVRLKTAGKYCDRDILVKATGGGVELPELTNAGVATDLMQGKQLIDGDGNVVDGTFTLQNELSEQDSLILAIKTALQGKASGGGGNGEEEVAALLENTMTVLDNSIATSLRTRACQGATKLVTVNLPNVTSLGGYAFYQCSGLETVTLPKLTSVSTQTFYSCTKLKHADCGNLANIPAQTFNACSALTELILRKTGSICTLSNINGINNSPIGKGTGYVYVPQALIEPYKTATNWVNYASQFRAIEDYPEICGT